MQLGENYRPIKTGSRQDQGRFQFLIQAESRQVSAYVPSRIKAGSRLCSRQDQGRFQFMFQAGPRQVPGYVPGKSKAGFGLCSKQNQGRFRIMFQAGSRQAQVMFQPGQGRIKACPGYVPGRMEAGSTRIPGYVLGRIQTGSGQDPGWLQVYRLVPSLFQAGWSLSQAGWTLFLAESHAFSGTLTVPNVYMYSTVDMYLPYTTDFTVCLFSLI